MFRRLGAAGLFALCAIAAGAATVGPAAADPLKDCNSPKLDDAIYGCSRIINDRSSDNNLLVSAYHNRALAYVSGSQWGRALADYDKLIGLKPDIASYYLERAKVHLVRDE